MKAPYVVLKSDGDTIKCLGREATRLAAEFWVKDDVMAWVHYDPEGIWVCYD